MSSADQFALHIEAEMDDVAVFYDVVFAFQAPFSSVFGALFAFVLYVVVIGNHFGADEAFFEVGVDYAGRLWGGGANGNGSKPELLLRLR